MKIKARDGNRKDGSFFLKLVN